MHTKIRGDDGEKGEGDKLETSQEEEKNPDKNEIKRVLLFAAGSGLFPPGDSELQPVISPPLGSEFRYKAASLTRSPVDFTVCDLFKSR